MHNPPHPPWQESPSQAPRAESAGAVCQGGERGGKQSPVCESECGEPCTPQCRDPRATRGWAQTRDRGYRDFPALQSNIPSCAPVREARALAPPLGPDHLLPAASEGTE